MYLTTKGGRLGETERVKGEYEQDGRVKEKTL
jgi:hypothetical protein